SGQRLDPAHSSSLQLLRAHRRPRRTASGDGAGADRQEPRPLERQARCCQSLQRLAGLTLKPATAKPLIDTGAITVTPGYRNIRLSLWYRRSGAADYTHPSSQRPPSVATTSPIHPHALKTSGGIGFRVISQPNPPPTEEELCRV